MNARIDQILGDVALFVEVAKAKSIKRAAEALGIPDSTLSRRMTELERLLGVQLLHRTTRRLELTEAGRTYYAECRKIVEAAELANAQLRDQADSAQGVLRLSLPVDFSVIFVGPLVAEFMRVYPLIHFDLHLTDNWVDLVENNIDIAIRLGQQPDSAMTVRHLGDIHYGLYASPEYIQKSGAPEHPADLRQHACVRMTCPHWSEVWTLLNDSGNSEQVRVEERIAANNLGLVRLFATMGLGIAPLDVLLAHENVVAGSLCRVLPGWKFREVPVFALTHAKMVPAKTRAFLNFLANRMRDGMLDSRLAEGTGVRQPKLAVL